MVKLTDVTWGERTHSTTAVTARHGMEWKPSPHYDFIRMPGMAEPMLLTVDFIVHERKKLTSSTVVTKIGSICFDLRDHDIGHDDEAQWYRLVTEEGVNSPGMVLLQVCVV